jgi:hypothetical protein
MFRRSRTAWLKNAFRHVQSDHKEIEMNARTEGTIAIVAALVVLFSAMWDPRISVTVSVVALAALGAYRFVKKDK